MNSLFISGSALELVREGQVDLFEFLRGRLQNQEGLISVSGLSGTAYGTLQDKPGCQGLIIHNPEALDVQIVGDEFHPYLIKRLIMASSIANSGNFRLDASWGPHYEDGFISFYIAPIAKSADFRAVCSVTDFGDLCLWALVPKGTLDSSLGLEHDDVPDVKKLKADLDEAIALQQEEMQSQDNSNAITVNLRVLPPTDFIRDRSYREWTENLTREQRDFVFSDVDHVQRLIGPAGSGKTLSLCLKAIFETRKRIESNIIPTVLFLTHSWALSFEVDEQIQRLDPLASQFISVYPLLELARERIQQTFPGHSFRPVGDDSAEAKEFMHQKMRDLIDEFLTSDWVTFKASCSKSFIERAESVREREIFVWDVLNEIGSVINGTGLFPTKTDERRYVNLVRNNWMMELDNESDRRSVFSLYRQLQSELESEGLISYDQELTDFLRFLGSNAWNLARGEDGWDLIYVDEFHKLNNQEREVLHYLTKMREQPPIRFATDLMQGSSNSRMIRPGVLDSESTESEEYGRIVNVTLKQVHRYTPQILDLANHIVKATAEVFDLPEGSSVSAENGMKPTVVRNGSLAAEIIWTIDHINNLRRASTAIIVVDDRQFKDWSSDRTNRFLIMKGKDDARMVSRSPQKTVIARAEDVSGLQFEHVFLVGLTDEFEGTTAPGFRREFLKNFYTGVTRSSSSVTIVYNDDQGCPGVVRSAIRESICSEMEGFKV